MTAILTTRSFGQALCDHFGIPSNQVAEKLTIHTEPNEIFGATLQIYLTGDDMESIGKIMKEMK